MNLPKPKTILIVEDEPKLAALLAEYLAQASFATHCLSHGLEVIPWLRAHTPDLMLLDLMLPGRDGIEICREARTFTDVPIIITTARIDEIDRLLGLELGADDYICKPYSPREVVARVRAVFRRSDAKADGAPHGLGFTVDAERLQIRWQGRLLDLTAVEFRLLNTLISHPGQIFSRDQLLDNIHRDYRVVTERTVDSHIKNLRKKLAAVAPEREWVGSVYGLGYKLEA